MIGRFYERLFAVLAFSSPSEQRTSRYRKHARKRLRSVRDALSATLNGRTIVLQTEISPSDVGARIRMPLTVLELHHLHERTAEMIWKDLQGLKFTLEWIGDIGTMEYLGAAYLKGYFARNILSDPDDAQCWYRMRFRIKLFHPSLET